MWGNLRFLFFLCGIVHSKVYTYKKCSDCLQENICVFLITATGGVCVEKSENLRFITKVRSNASCPEVEGILMPKSLSSDPPPETQPLIAVEGVDSDRMTELPMTLDEQKKVRSVNKSPLSFVKTRGIKIQLIEAQCNFYIALFQQIHPKSIKLDKEYGRCMRSSST